MLGVQCVEEPSMQEKRREAQEERLKERLAMAETRDSLANRRAALGAAAACASSGTDPDNIIATAERFLAWIEKSGE